MTNSTHIDFKASRRFRRLALNTVISLYLLIIAGGVVRSTGAGMGCPDWPRCFGRWVPPTQVSELPHNYKEIYGAKLKGEIEFNPVKTWIEYVNRLMGAFTGVMIFLTLLASIYYLRKGPSRIFYYSLAAFILVGLQGWLGAKVVSSELMPVMITLHMLLAVVIVFIALYLFTWSSYFKGTFEAGIHQDKLSRIGLIVLALSLIQILLGTQVRENMDEVIRRLGYGERALWMEQLDARFYIHRSFSIVIVLVNVFWLGWVRKLAKQEVVRRMARWSLVILGIELLSGIAMPYLGVPPFAQPLHLVLAIALIGIQFVIWMLVNENKFLTKENLERGELV